MSTTPTSTTVLPDPVGSRGDAVVVPPSVAGTTGALMVGPGPRCRTVSPQNLGPAHR